MKRVVTTAEPYTSLTCGSPESRDRKKKRRKLQVLAENQSSIFQCNIVPRKADLVSEYLHREIVKTKGLDDVYHVHLELCEHYWSTVFILCQFLRKTWETEKSLSNNLERSKD